MPTETRCHTRNVPYILSVTVAGMGCLGAMSWRHSKVNMTGEVHPSCGGVIESRISNCTLAGYILHAERSDLRTRVHPLILSGHQRQRHQDGRP